MRRIISYVNFTARSTGAVVWVVNYTGEIILHTGIPGSVSAKLVLTDRSGYYRLPAQYLAAMGSGTSGVSLSGDFHGLVSGNRHHLAFGCLADPVGNGGYNGEIQLHYPQQTRQPDQFPDDQQPDRLFSGGLWHRAAVYRHPVAQHHPADPAACPTPPTRSRAATCRSASSCRASTIRSAWPDRDALVTDDLTVLVTTMNTMIEKLENQERDRKDFISSVSHDLRTPITSIRGFVEGMLDGTVPPDRFPHYLEIVKQETLRLQTLVNTMFEAQPARKRTQNQPDGL